jgi:hypothetical protein
MNIESILIPPFIILFGLIFIGFVVIALLFFIDRGKPDLIIYQKDYFKDEHTNLDLNEGDSSDVPRSK